MDDEHYATSQGRSIRSPDTKQPLVTIVTPSRNQGLFIRDTVESVLAQDYPRIEYIVVDGGSTDSTLDILAEYGDRLSWTSEPDKGQGNAINKGWSRARGDILGWLNSDDTLLPGAISGVVDALVRDPDAVGAYGPGLMIDASGTTIGELDVPDILNADDVLLDKDPVLQPAFFVRAVTLDRIGPVSERLHWILDWDFVLRVVRAGPVARVDARLAANRVHDATKTSTGGIARLSEIFRWLRRLRAPISAPSYRFYTYLAVTETLGRARRRGSRFVDRWPVAWLRGLLDREIQRLHGGGLYRDGWAAPRLRWRSAHRGSNLQICGAVYPHLYPPLRDQELTVRVDGRLVTHLRLPNGEFDVCVPLTGVLTQHPLVELRARRSFVPKRLGLNRDCRRLSYQLSRIRLV